VGAAPWWSGSSSWLRCAGRGRPMGGARRGGAGGGDLALWCCARAPRTARTATAATTMTAAAMGPPSRRGRWFMLDIALSRPRPEIAFSEMGAGPVPSSNTRGLARGGSACGPSSATRWRRPGCARPPPLLLASLGIEDAHRAALAARAEPLESAERLAVALDGVHLIGPAAAQCPRGEAGDEQDHDDGEGDHHGPIQPDRSASVNRTGARPPASCLRGPAAGTSVRLRCAAPHAGEGPGRAPSASGWSGPWRKAQGRRCPSPRRRRGRPRPAPARRSGCSSCPPGTRAAGR